MLDGVTHAVGHAWFRMHQLQRALQVKPQTLLTASSPQMAEPLHNVFSQKARGTIYRSILGKMKKG